MEQRIYLVHQRPHAKKQKSMVVKTGDVQITVQSFKNPNKHTRRSFAGKFIPESNSLLIGIAGNHLDDTFVRSEGAKWAKQRVEAPSEELQSQKKQVVINNLANEEEARKAFFREIENLKI